MPTLLNENFLVWLFSLSLCKISSYHSQYPLWTFVSTIVFFFLKIKILFISKTLNFWSLNNQKNAHFDWKVYQLRIIWANLPTIYYSPPHFSQSFNMSDFLIFLSILIFTYVRPVFKKGQKKYAQWLWKRYLS